MNHGSEADRYESLLDGVRAGQRGDLEALLSLTRPHLLRAIRNMRASIFAQFDPEDVWQEASLQALHSQRQIRALDLTGFRSWFLGIARHIVAKMHRSQRKRVRPRKATSLPARQMNLVGPELLEETAIWSGATQPEDSRDRQEKLAPLRSEQKTVLVLHELFSTEWDTLALILDRPSNSAARAVHHRARTAALPPGVEPA